MKRTRPTTQHFHAMRTLYTLVTALAITGATQAQIVFQNDFESWTGGLPDSWVGAKTSIETDSIAQETVNPQSGASACRLTNRESTHKRFTTGSVAVTNGTVYEITFWVRGAGEIRTGLYDGRTSGSGYSAYNAYATVGSSWVEVTQTVTCAHDTADGEFILSVHNSAGPDEIVVDNVTISVGTIDPPTPQTIHDIQFTSAPDGASPLAGTAVATGGIVTGAYGSGYWIQNGNGPWSGLFVFDGSIAPAIGDSVTVTGNVTEYFGLTEVNGVTAAAIVSSGNPVPTTTDITTAAANTEPYESVLVRVANADCTVLPDGNGQWKVNDGSGDVFVDDLLFAYTPAVGVSYNVTGPLSYSFSEWKIEPRDANDIEIFNGVLELDATDVTVMPNPTSDLLVIERTTNAPIDYTLLDAAGRTMIAGRATGSRFTVDVRALATGSYTLTLNDGTTLRGARVMVAR